jgi:hypothetical protein
MQSNRTRRKLAVALVGCLATCLCGCRRDRHSVSPDRTDAHSAAPAIAFAESAHDFGLVNEGAHLRHVFEVRNQGNAPLVLSGVATSCGCTAATLGDKTIPPGGSAPLEVVMDTHGEHGKGTRTITVSSNDPHQPASKVEIAYDVERLLFLDRSFVTLTTARRRQHVERVWLDGDLSKQARLRVVDLKGSPPVKVRLLGGKRPGLQLDLRADHAVSGEGSVTLATGLSTAPELTLPFRYEVK